MLQGRQIYSPFSLQYLQVFPHDLSCRPCQKHPHRELPTSLPGSPRRVSKRPPSHLRRVLRHEAHAFRFGTLQQKRPSSSPLPTFSLAYLRAPDYCGGESRLLIPQLHVPHAPVVTFTVPEHVPITTGGPVLLMHATW